MSNLTLVINNVESRSRRLVPLLGNSPLPGNGTPIDPLSLHHLLELDWIVMPAVDAEQGEGSVFQFFDERPLVGPTSPSRQSVLGPKIEEHDLAAIVTQFETHAILVKALRLWSQLADGQCE